MEIKLLKDVCSISKGQQINGDDLLKKGDYKFFNGGINASGYWNEYNVKDNSISISEGGNSCGYVNYQIEPFWCGAHCYYLYDLKVSSKYLYYYLKYRQSDLMAIRSGVCMPNIKKKDLENFKINLKSIDNQHDVINTLEKIESLIQIDTKKLEKLDEIVKSQFIEMFGKLEDTEYTIDTLNNICEFIKDGTHQTPTYTEDEDGYIFVSSKDVTSGKIDWDNTKRIPKELHEQLYSRIAPKKNDILLSKNGTIGFAVLVEEDRIFDIYVSLAILRQNKLNPVFMKEQLNAEDCQKQFYSSLKGVGVPNLHLGEIKKTKVIVPPIELQNKFADFVQQIDKSKYFGGVNYGIC